MDFLEEPSHVDDPQAFHLLGAYYGYPHCCTLAFIYRRYGVPSEAASFALGFHEDFKLSGTGYVPCRHCEEQSVEEQLSKINRLRLHPFKFVETPVEDSMDEEVFNKAYLSGKLFDVFIETVVEAIADTTDKKQIIWQWSEYQIKEAQMLLDKISERDKNDRPAAQMTHLRARCVSLGNLRYRLVRESKK